VVVVVVRWVVVGCVGWGGLRVGIPGLRHTRILPMHDLTPRLGGILSDHN
jgi:hypothetical protein